MTHVRKVFLTYPGCKKLAFISSRSSVLTERKKCQNRVVKFSPSNILCHTRCRHCHQIIWLWAATSSSWKCVRIRLCWTMCKRLRQIKWALIMLRSCTSISPVDILNTIAFVAYAGVSTESPAPVWGVRWKQIGKCQPLPPASHLPDIRFLLHVLSFWHLTLSVCIFCFNR